MKHIRFDRIIIVILIVLAVVFFLLQTFLFHDLHESGFLFFQDMMFLPVHILLVTFLLDRIINEREKRNRKDQLNIVIGAFFSEIGNDAIEVLNRYIINLQEIAAILDIKPGWENKDFDNAAKSIKNYELGIGCRTDDPKTLKKSLRHKKGFILDMFNNPNMLEHSRFTDMLWALYHLIDELENREDAEKLPDTDISHLCGDITRAYGLLLHEWVLYMKHLKKTYPYLFSIAVRKNPFAKNSIIVQ